uniref:Uncharacterized protein n=1 Tax=viral metagenome TaxID=1070528 RepID=A0A6M3LA38_9ZZZZ
MPATDHAIAAEKAINEAILELMAFGLEAEAQNEDAETVVNALDDCLRSLTTLYNAYKGIFAEATYEPEQHDEDDWRIGGER